MRRILPFLLVLAFACGGAQKKLQVDAAQDGLMTAAAATATAYDLFVVWDHETEMSIVNKAASAEEGRAALAAHRLRKAPVLGAFEVVAISLRAASKALAINDPDPAVVARLAADALRDVLALQQAIARMKGETP